MSYDRNQAPDATQAKALRSGAYCFTILSGDAFQVWANSEAEAEKKLYDHFQFDSCLAHTDRYCECVELIEARTEILDPDRVNRIIDALTSDAILLHVDTYLLERITQIIEGTK